MEKTNINAEIVSRYPEEFRWELNLGRLPNPWLRVHGFAPDYETAVKNMLLSLEDWLIPVIENGVPTHTPFHSRF